MHASRKSGELSRNIFLFNKKILVILALVVLTLIIVIIYVLIGERQELPSDAKPYYLEVEKVRFILDAKRLKKRLERMGFPSFYAPLKKIKTGRWILVGIGPEKDIGNIKELQRQATSRGIKSILRNYIKKRDSFVTDSTERKKILKGMHNWYKKIRKKKRVFIPKILSVMPYVSEFSVDRLIYIDHEANPLKRLLKIYIKSFPREVLSFRKNFKESAAFYYVDRLKKEKVEVFGAVLKSEVKRNFAEKYDSKIGSFRCTKNKSVYTCIRSQYVFVIIGSNDNILIKFISSIGSGIKNDPYAYNLFLSSFSIGIDAVLQLFTIDYVGESYVALKYYARWAKMMRGYWTSTAFFMSSKGNFQVQLFDLEGKNYSASVYKVFSKDKYKLRKSLLYEFMKAMQVYYVPVKVRDKKGWYIDGASIGESKEVSFTCDEYIVAVNTEPALGKFLMRKGLINVAKNLNIFEKK